MKLIEREDYLNKLINVIGTPDIKVITGIRRSGKSKLLEQFRNYIIKTIENSNIIHINYNLSKFENLKSYSALVDYIESNYKAGMENFILIDEVQMCDDFGKAINGFHAEEKFKYIKDVLNTLIVRNIKQKYKIRNTDIIQNLTDFLMDNISNLTSANNITHVLNSNNVSITDKTINNYIEYLCNEFSFYKVKRYDIKEKNS